MCFDVDSTVCMDEAIDELARFAGRDKEVADLTNKAMRGGMTFREALERRLDLIKPTARMLQEYIEQNPPRLSTGIEELVAQLQSRGVAVYLVSGGFRSIIEGVADEIGIPRKNIFANQIKFYFNGGYSSVCTCHCALNLTQYPLAGFWQLGCTCRQYGRILLLC